MTQPVVPKVESGRRVATENGVNDIWTPASDVLCFASHGTVEVVFGDALIHDLETMLAQRGKLHLFADTWGVTDYDPRFREQMTTWFKHHRSQLHGVHVLVKSPLVRMGVATINLMLGGLLTTYSDAAKYAGHMGLTARGRR